MGSGDRTVRATAAKVGERLRGAGRVVLAVSGGCDSMVMLDAALRTIAPGQLVVATFDHRTGPHSAAAVRLVRTRAETASLRCVVGTADSPAATEAEWRAARWRFLHRVAADERARTATAHTLDDQIETVFIRVLRGSGPRGLAGLLADSAVLRPMLTVRRADTERYAREAGVDYVEDPSNRSRAHLRNRVRLDILPAIERLSPGFSDWLLDIAARSASWRQEVERAVDALGVTSDGSALIARQALAPYDAASLRTLWPAIATRAGVTMDRRGTHRAAAFTMEGRIGRSIQLSGGAEIVMRRDHLLLRRRR